MRQTLLHFFTFIAVSSAAIFAMVVFALSTNVISGMITWPSWISWIPKHPLLSLLGAAILTVVSWVGQAKVSSSMGSLGNSKEFTREDVHEAMQSAGIGTSYDFMIAKLPPYPKYLVEAYMSELAEFGWILKAFAGNDLQPLKVAAEWAVSLPEKVSTLPASGRVILAEILAAYSQPGKAVDLIREAIDLGIGDRISWLSRIAILSYQTSDPRADVAQWALRRIDELSPGYAFSTAFRALMSKEWQTAIDAISNWDAQSPRDMDTAISMKTNAHTALGLYDEAIRTLEEYERKPQNPGLLLTEARLRLYRAATGSGDSRWQDAFKAIELAITARNLRRTWRGDSAEAVVVAIESAVAARDAELAWKLARPTPDGEASQEEAVDGRVLELAGSAAAISGRLEYAHELREQTTDPIIRARINAEVIRAASGEGDNSDAISAWRVYLALAQSVEAKLYALRALAFEGTGASEVLEELRDEYPEAVRDIELISQVMSVPEDDTDRALRQLESSHVLASVRRAEHAAESDPSKAAEILVNAYERWKDPQLLLQAVDYLVEAELWMQAATIVDRALTQNSSLWPGRRALLLRSATIGGRMGDWQRVERSCRSLIELDANDTEARWGLAIVQVNNGLFEEAWGTLRRGNLTDPGPVVFRAHVLLQLGSKFANSITMAQIALRVIDLLPGEEEVRAHAIQSFAMRDDRTDVPAEISARISQAWVDFISDFPQSRFISRFKIDDEEFPEDLLRALRQKYEDHQKIVSDVSERGLPIGVIQPVLRMPYTTLLINNILGYIPIASAIPEDAQFEKAALELAHERRCLLDGSALNTLAILGSRAQDLVLEIDQLSVLTSTTRDIRLARDDLTVPTSGHIFYDPSSGRPTYTGASSGESNHLLERCDSMLRLADQVGTIQHDKIVHLEDLGFDSVCPWVMTLDAAIEQDCVVWCDDVGLRRILRGMGVPSFGTATLIELLEGRGSISSEQSILIKEELIKERLVDLDPGTEILLKIARGEIWRPGSVALVLSRPLIWGDSEAACRLFLEIFDRASVADLNLWARAAAKGLVSASPGQTASSNLTRLATVVFLQPGSNPMQCRAIVDAVDEVSTDEHDRLFPKILENVWKSLVESFGIRESALILRYLTSEMGEPDRQTVIGIIATHR